MCADFGVLPPFLYLKQFHCIYYNTSILLYAKATWQKILFLLLTSNRRFLFLGSVVLVTSLKFRSIPYFLKSGNPSYIFNSMDNTNKDVPKVNTCILFSRWVKRHVEEYRS